MRIGIVGCGAHSRDTHGPCLREYASLHPDVTLAACCDKDPSAAGFYQKRFGFVRAYRDAMVMLQEESLDAVWIVLPERYTAEAALSFLEAGIPVLVEKPPGMDPAETRAMLEAAERRGVPNRVAFNRRHAPLARRLRDFLAPGEPGRRVFSLTYEMIRVDRRDPDFSSTAIHAIDTVSFLAGSDYRELSFQYTELPHLGPGVANITADGYLRNGSAVRLNVFPCSGEALERATVRGESFSCELDFPHPQRKGGSGRLALAENGNITLESGEDDWLRAFGFYEETAGFLDRLRTGGRPENDLRSALPSVEIMASIRHRRPLYRGLT